MLNLDAKLLLICLALAHFTGCSSNGSDGREGAQGTEGTRGEQGATGGAGPQGPAGPPGMPGRDGEAGFKWRAVWDPSTAYEAGDVVRDLAGSAIYLALRPSEDVEPLGDSANWSLLLSNQSLARASCPEGMSRLPNKACMDRAPRRTFGEDPTETFGLARAMELCQASDARLCTVDEFHQRAGCVRYPGHCDSERPWAGDDLDLSVERCVPVHDVPYDNTYDTRQGQQLGERTLDGGIYIYVGVIEQQGRDVVLVDTCTRDKVVDIWLIDRYAEYTCCLDQ